MSLGQLLVCCEDLCFPTNGEKKVLWGTSQLPRHLRVTWEVAEAPLTSTSHNSLAMLFNFHLNTNVRHDVFRLLSSATLLHKHFYKEHIWVPSELHQHARGHWEVAEAPLTSTSHNSLSCNAFQFPFKYERSSWCLSSPSSATLLHKHFYKEHIWVPSELHQHARGSWEVAEAPLTSTSHNSLSCNAFQFPFKYERSSWCLSSP